MARWRNAIIVAFALGGITLAAFGSRLPSIQASLGVSKTAIGTALMAVTVGSLTGLGLAAGIHRHLGARRGIGGSLGLIAAGISAIGLGAGIAHSLAVTSAGLAAVGFGIGVLDVLINVEGAAIEGAVGRTLMPLLHAAWSAGAVIGAALGATSAALGLAVHWQFTAEAATLLVTAGYVVLGIPPHEAPVKGPDEHPAERPTLRRRLRRRASGRASGQVSGRTSARLLVIGLVMLGAELGEGSANNWLTLAAREEHHRSEAVAAAFFVLFAVGETVARLLGGPLVDRHGRVAVVRATSAAGVLGVMLFILTDRWWLTGLGVVLWAVGVSMGFPLGMSAAAESGPNSAAQVSVVATIGYAANLAGPPTIGLLADRLGLLRSLWVVVALLFLACVCAPAVRAVTIRPPEPSGPPADGARSGNSALSPRPGSSSGHR